MNPNDIRNRSNPIDETLEYIDKVRQFTQYMSENEFISDEKTIFAVTRALEMISSSTRRASQIPSIRQRFDHIPWKEIIRINGKLSHPYQTVNPKVLWKTAKEDIPRIDALLRDSLGLPQESRSFARVQITLTNDEALTANTLVSLVNPFLESITNLQNIIDDIQGRHSEPVIIRSITYYSPVNATLEGATQAASFLRETIIPWRREHAKVLAALAEQEKVAEIENKQAELLERRARSLKDRAEAERIRVEAIKQKEEAEKLRLENEKLRLELQRTKVQLALELLASIAPTLPESEKITYIIKLLPVIDIMTSSPQLLSNDNA